jgi:hypothetical protein
MFLAMLLIMNILMIVARSVYLYRVPVWVYVVDCCLLGAAAFFAILETRRQRGRQKNSQENA